MIYGRAVPLAAGEGAYYRPDRPGFQKFLLFSGVAPLGENRIPPWKKTENHTWEAREGAVSLPYQTRALALPPGPWLSIGQGSRLCCFMLLHSTTGGKINTNPATLSTHSTTVLHFCPCSHCQQQRTNYFQDPGSSPKTRKLAHNPL